MFKPKLFISHSTNGLPVTDRCVRVRELLSSALTGWDVFIDKERIEPGAKWRSKILYHLANTQAGIILFNERATCGSNWVSAEALILCFRKSIDPSFQIIPVLFDGKKVNNTCFQKYEPFQLNEVQAISDDTSISPEELVSRIVNSLDASRVQEPQKNHWVDNVGRILRGICIDTLQVAANQLELEVDEEVIEIHSGTFKNQLLRTIVEFMHYETPAKSIMAFKELITELDSKNTSLLRKYLTAKWVENESAEIMLYASRKPKETGILTINARQQEEVIQYVNRALIEYGNKGQVWFFSVSGDPGEGDEAKLYQIEQAIKEKVMFNKYYIDNSGQELPLCKAIEKLLSNPNDFVICTLPSQYAKESILREIRNRYPRIIFIVGVGANAENLFLFNNIGGKPLTPPLNIEKYNALIDLQNRLQAAIYSKKLR